MLKHFSSMVILGPSMRKMGICNFSFVVGDKCNTLFCVRNILHCLVWSMSSDVEAFFKHGDSWPVYEKDEHLQFLICRKRQMQYAILFYKYISFGSQVVHRMPAQTWQHERESECEAPGVGHVALLFFVSQHATKLIPRWENVSFLTHRKLSCKRGKQCPSIAMTCSLPWSITAVAHAVLSMWWGCHWCNISDRQLCHSISSCWWRGCCGHTGTGCCWWQGCCGHTGTGCAFLLPMSKGNELSLSMLVSHRASGENSVHRLPWHTHYLDQSL